MKVDFILNGEDISVQAAAGERLSGILRLQDSLPSVRGDCGSGHCGLCLVILDGRTVPACLVPAFRVHRAEVITIEGFVQTDEYVDLREGFSKTGAEPCAFCRGAVLLAASSLLEEDLKPNPREILERLSAVFCRCHDPHALVRGVQAAAALRARRVYSRANQ
ncbi:MAG TPA: 2Fe-2S iron-sulfur cluster-binding protein [Magnetospirillaceae bacterium]|nr:2Fe-2S iron-sulfur cluster-binding protein [Magnetospirillaceae bacterium]